LAAKGKPVRDPVTSLVILVFSAPGAALWLAAAIFAAGIALVVMSGMREYGPLKQDLVDRWNRLSALRGATGQREFHDRFNEYDVQLGAAATQSPALMDGWSNFRGLLVDNGDGRLATTARAGEVFAPLDEPARTLEWWANILVALGLVITFLGIVAALSEATGAIGTGNPAEVQAALMGLLAIAATKFWTSIAGVLASIVLRVIARLRRRRIHQLETSFFTALDACIVYMPPEKVALEQMNALHRIETALQASDLKVAS
jgi:hypothetical protein